MFKIKEDANLQPVFIKSFKVDALCVPLARQPKATHKAVSIALLPPTFIKAKPNSKPKTTYASKSNAHMLREIKWVLTSVLSSDEIDPISELNFEATMAHEVF